MQSIHLGTSLLTLPCAFVQELVRLHGGTLTVTSTTEDETPGSHGSHFTVRLPLGKEHIAPAHIVQNPSELPQHRQYARGIVEEATHWASMGRPDELTPSESSDSGGSTDSGSRMDPNTLFFVKSDVILLGEWRVVRLCGYLRICIDRYLPGKWMIMEICAE